MGKNSESNFLQVSEKNQHDYSYMSRDEILKCAYYVMDEKDVNLLNLNLGFVDDSLQHRYAKIGEEMIWHHLIEKHYGLPITWVNEITEQQLPFDIIIGISAEELVLQNQQWDQLLLSDNNLEFIEVKSSMEKIRKPFFHITV